MLLLGFFSREFSRCMTPNIQYDPVFLLSHSELQTQSFRASHSIYSFAPISAVVHCSTRSNDISFLKAKHKGKCEQMMMMTTNIVLKRSLKIDARFVKMVFGRFHR